MYNNNNNSVELIDDDDFFVPITSSSSNLAHLFAPINPAQPDLTCSLTYTSPKQPKATDNHLQQSAVINATTQHQQKKLICVKTGSLAQLVGTSSMYVGKIGIAIITDHISTDLILYKTKQNILSTTKLTSSFQCKQVSELVLSFLDHQNITWLVTFETIRDKSELLAELAKQGVKKQELIMSKVDSTSISDAFSSRLIAEKPEEEKTRADILGRMSKLGMSIIPGSELLPSTSTKASSRTEKEFSESEPEEVIRTTKVRKVRGRHSESAIETMDLVTKPAASASQFTPFAANVQHVTLGHQLMDPLNIYFAENRTHNSEVRMNLSQLGSKIDTLLSELRPRAPLRTPLDSDFLERRITELERKLEQQAIPQAHPQTTMDELQRKLEEQVNENVERTLRYEETITSLQSQLAAVENTLETERSASKDAMETNNSERASLEQTSQLLEADVSELRALVEKQKLKLADIAECEKLHREEKLLRLAREATEQELNQKVESLQSALDESNKKIGELELLYQQVLESRAKDEDGFADLVKESMNVMYQCVLTDSIDSTTNLDVRDLKKILQKHLKATTFSIINQYSKRKDIENSSTPMQMSTVSPEFEVTV